MRINLKESNVTINIKKQLLNLDNAFALLPSPLSSTPKHSDVSISPIKLF